MCGREGHLSLNLELDVFDFRFFVLFRTGNINMSVSSSVKKAETQISKIGKFQKYLQLLLRKIRSIKIENHVENNLQYCPFKTNSPKELNDI